MKLIFLDIDGVLNSHDYFLKRYSETGKMQGGIRPESIDPDALRRLERILEETDAKIIVSSTWRLGQTVEQLQDLLESAGFLYPETIVGRTGSTDRLTERRGTRSPRSSARWLRRRPTSSSTTTPTWEISWTVSSRRIFNTV